MTGSAVPRQLLGRELKVLRERSGISATDAARSIEVSPQTLWRIESGQPGPKLKELYVHVLCQMYGATEAVTTALTSLVVETRRPCWWHQFEDVVPEHAALRMDLEWAAERITVFRPDLIPDLLQIPEYQRELAHVEVPGRSVHEVDRMIEVVHRRGERLRNSPSCLVFRALVCETALHNPVGDVRVMRNQLEHLLTAGEMPNVSIRIVPQCIGRYPGLLTGPFDLMEFPVRPMSQLVEPPVVYVPGYVTAQYLDREQQTARYRAAIAEIQRVALDDEASRQLLLDLSCAQPGGLET